MSQAQLVLKLQEQWIQTDITCPGVMERAMLPPNLSDTQKIVLPGPITLQVQHGHDIGSPAYGQLQKLHQVDLENARVSADDSQASQAGQGGYQATQGGRYQQGWEPRPQRMMMLSVTDGFQTIEAMEHQLIRDIPDVVEPGVKIQVMGPVTVRRGIMMLTNVRMLGGAVEELAEQFSLQTILQQKIGKEDVGQKGNMFATQNVPAPAPRQQPSLAPAPVQARVPSPSMDDMSDDDDMLLLVASQVDMAEAVTSTQTNQIVSKTPNNRGSVLPSRPDHYQPMLPARVESQQQLATRKTPPVGVVQPLRTIASNLSQTNPSSGDGDTKRAQSSITSFMVPKSSSATPSLSVPVSSSTVTTLDTTPSFSLFDSDDEFMSDVPMDPTPTPVQTVPDEPFQYLMNVKAAMQARPQAHFTTRLKVVSSTLASKMSLRKTVRGPQWQVAIMLNDGSDSIKASLAPELLDQEIGPASQYVELGISQQTVKMEYKERMKKFSVKLAELNCLVTLQVEGEDSSPTIVKMEEVTGLHSALMRKRRIL